MKGLHNEIAPHEPPQPATTLRPAVHQALDSLPAPGCGDGR